MLAGSNSGLLHAGYPNWDIVFVATNTIPFMLSNCSCPVSSETVQKKYNYYQPIQASKGISEEDQNDKKSVYP
jgi:hypothetical protein